MKIEAAIFDIGNVLLFFDYMKAANRLVAKNRLAAPPDRAKITALCHEFELGHTSRAEFISSVRAEFHDNGDESDFVAAWEDIFEENTVMTALARRLAEHVPVFLISNIGEIHHGFITRKFEVFSIFRDGLFSYRIGLMKPDPKVFELAVEQFGVDPGKALYFDDILENCEAAEKAGFLARHYDRHREDLPAAWGIPL